MYNVRTTVKIKLYIVKLGCILYYRKCIRNIKHRKKNLCRDIALCVSE
uniref:Uncharacterized protein n=1 Tax=Anguilla anguilla TaxID=7936 RepID=A0A0E9WKF3_ANGAN